MGLLSIVLGAILLGLGIGVAQNLSLRGLVIAGAALAPALQWALRELRRQLAAATARGNLAELLVERWRECLRSGDWDAVDEVRGYQNVLFDRRRADPEVFGWLYRLFRPVDEADMASAAEKMVTDWQQLSS